MGYEAEGQHLDPHLDPGGDRTTSRPERLKNSLIVRLSRIEGQIRGIKGMVEKEAYCDDVLNQIAAAQAALNSVGKLLLENHLKGCVASRVQAGEIQVLDELLLTIGKLIK
ncbi:MAG TPA: metal-sensitive transcriptional regulator [Anaerovoracaceae bacterium]|nr:metal-sensitive transcriptional regulator [Anaerovoracaceae bacterium]